MSGDFFGGHEEIPSWFLSSAAAPFIVKETRGLAGGGPADGGHGG